MKDKTAVIKKGRHYSSNASSYIFGMQKGLTLIAEVRFRSDCLYPPLPTDYKSPCRNKTFVCRGDWNKLIGIMPPLGLHPHHNSARITWKVDHETMKFYIGRYMYVDWIAPNISAPWYCRGYNRNQKNTFKNTFATGISADEWFKIRIEDTHTGYRFQYNDDDSVYYHTTQKDYPYFNRKGIACRRNTKIRIYNNPIVISPFFGGNCPAPQTCTIDFKFYKS